MKVYKTRPGVVLTTIGGLYVLVSAKMAREYCPYTMQINESAAFCWRVLEEGADIDTLAVSLGKEYGVEPAELEDDVKELIGQLEANGYLITV